MADKDIPCCAADAMRRVKQIDVGGIVVGITMLEETITKVRKMDLCDKKEISDCLIKEVKVYNYIPASAEPKYREAIIREYENRSVKL